MNNDNRKVENIVAHTRLAIEFSKLPKNADSEEEYKKVMDRKNEILIEIQKLRKEMKQLLLAI